MRMIASLVLVEHDACTNAFWPQFKPRRWVSSTLRRVRLSSVTRGAGSAKLYSLRSPERLEMWRFRDRKLVQAGVEQERRTNHTK